ncbi:hypothetical protein TNCV_1452771 [Trichonephila clavipes]|nr:hypothetical protein TNCV_1452771 [Trichonephila clavipes]
MENFMELRRHSTTWLKTSDCRNKKWYEKKRHYYSLEEHRSETPRRMQCLPPNVISTVAEETSKFAMKEPTFE